MRRGVALLITLGVITTLITLIGISFSYLDKAKQNSTDMSALIQANILYKDISKVLVSLLGSKEANSVISTMYLLPVVIQEEGGEFYMNINCNPTSNGIDINWLSLKDDKTKVKEFDFINHMLDLIIDKYDIEHGSKLMELIYQALEGDKVLYNIPSRIKEKKFIHSKKQFNNILKEYQFQTGDSKVFSIPWDKYLSFVDKNSLIDEQYLSADFISLFFNIEIEDVLENWVEGSSLVKFLQDSDGDMSLYDKKLFSSSAIKHMQCSTTYNYNSQSYRFSFNYTDKKVDNFEFQTQ
jgi:hypothetical protein